MSDLVNLRRFFLGKSFSDTLLFPGVHTSLTKWLDCVLCVQDRRRKEVLG